MIIGASYLIGKTPAQLETMPGQATWADLNSPFTCRECWLWSGGKRDDHGILKPAICRKAASMMFGRKPPPVPHDARACRFFDLRPAPPAIIKGLCGG
jgi:hypothetical protein